LKALFRLTLLQMLGRKKLWILLAFLSLPIFLVGSILLAGGLRGVQEEAAEQIAVVVLYVLYPQTLCILAALLYGASLLAGEIEDKTLVYLFTRALPRWKVLVGKYLATSVALSVLTSLSMTLCFVVFDAPFGLRVWLALFVAITGACFTYTAIFSLLGLLVPQRAIPVGILYGVVFELLLSSVPAVINELTTSYYLRSLAYWIADISLPPDIDEVVGLVTAPPVRAVLAILVISGVTLSLSALLIHRREWPLNEGV
jgi:ABC-type transport system involved in multi-copper enzyme maturation permease subunit